MTLISASDGADSPLEYPLKAVFAPTHCLLQVDEDVKLPAIRMKTERRRSHRGEVQGLFPNGRAVVIGLPKRFDLGKELRMATQIRLATAFAHLSGWRLLAPHLLRSNADIRLIAGLHFFQTEPEVLRQWLHLTKRNMRVQAYIVDPNGPMFHPKVLIVNNHRGRFAIVGSGNLSAGGLRDNIECSVFLENANVLAKLWAWFDTLLSDVSTLHLHGPDLAAYRVQYDKSIRPYSKVNSLQQNVERRIAVAREVRAHACYVVNTNRAHDSNAWAHMLDKNRASAFWDKKRAVEPIQMGNQVLLYHNKVGVIACGRVVAGFQVGDYGDGKGEEQFVPVKWSVKVNPNESPEKAVTIREIKARFRKIFLFRTTRRLISEKVARYIENTLKDRNLD